MPWFIDIVEYEGDRIEKTLGPYGSERVADRGDRGVNINLNHERFYTRVEERKGKKRGTEEAD